MRQANTAVICERYPIPTVDEVLQALNGSAVFSKLDLHWRFHQVELDERSRNITTFAVADSLFRFKRMMFGISCAPEKYQHVVRQVISDCEGALNIADDLIIDGTKEADHDRKLFRILDRLQQRGLTLNLPKCRFEPTAAKVSAVLAAPRPTTASELRSFLGTVGFSLSFIADFSTTAEPL